MDDLKQKIFLFDVDGVLIQNDSWAKDIYRDCGISLSQLQEFFDRDFGACLEGRADLKESLAHWLIRWRYQGTASDFLKYWFEADSKLNLEVFQMAKKVSQRFPCYLATNQEKYRASYLMNDMGFKEIFLDIFSACDLKAAKPSQDFFKAALMRLKHMHPDVSRSSIFFVDDSVRNVAAASQLGINSHHFTNIETFTGWLETIGPNGLRF